MPKTGHRWEEKDAMMKSMRGYAKGMAAGIAVGAAVGAICGRMMHNKKAVKKNAGKALRAVGDFLDNVQYMMK